MHRRTRAPAIVLAALVVVAAACSDSSTEEAILETTQVSVTEPGSSAVSGDTRSGSSTSTMPADTTPATSVAATGPDDEPEPSALHLRRDEPEPPTTTLSHVDEPERSTPNAGDLDASALLTAAGEASVGQSVRGEFAMDMGIFPSDPDAVLPVTTFETDADGNTAMTFSFPGSLSMEFRYVDGTAYVHPPPELLSSLGLETTVPEAWLTADEALAAELGVGCASLLPFLDPAGSNAGCDPLNETAMLLPEFGDHAVIIGREDLRGFPTTVVQLTPPVRELLAAGLEASPDSESELGDPEVVEDLFPLDARIRIDIWIDDDLRIHRTVVNLGSLMAGLADTVGADLEDMPQLMFTIDYYDHGAEIVVEAPLPEQVVGDLADFEGLGADAY